MRWSVQLCSERLGVKSKLFLESKSVLSASSWEVFILFVKIIMLIIKYSYNIATSFKINILTFLSIFR